MAPINSTLEPRRSIRCEWNADPIMICLFIQQLNSNSPWFRCVRFGQQRTLSGLTKFWSILFNFNCNSQRQARQQNKFTIHLAKTNVFHCSPYTYGITPKKFLINFVDTQRKFGLIYWFSSNSERFTCHSGGKTTNSKCYSSKYLLFKSHESWLICIKKEISASRKITFVVGKWKEKMVCMQMRNEHLYYWPSLSSKRRKILFMSVYSLFDLLLLLLLSPTTSSSSYPRSHAIERDYKKWK